MDCARSAFSVEVEEAASEDFYCPEYFSNRTCCLAEELSTVWEKVEDMLRFIRRVLDEQQGELLDPEPFEGGPCAEYHTRLLSSRTALYKRARHTAEKGADILQGAALHFLCAACFACAVPLKTSQVDDYVRRALLSVQDTMGAILEEQRLLDLSPDPLCDFGYTESLFDGAFFPAWGRFSPELRKGRGPLSLTLSAWLDRVLSLLLELPSMLLYQQSVLQLTFFYAERPGSDAYSLLVDVAEPSAPAADEAASDAGGAGGVAAAGIDLDVPGLDLCPAGPRRLLALVPQDTSSDELSEWCEALQADDLPWNVLWAVTSPSHVRALLQRCGRDVNPEHTEVVAVADEMEGDEAAAEVAAPEALASPAVVWRRFDVRDPDAFAAGLCGERAAWVLQLSPSATTLGSHDSAVRPSGAAPEAGGGDEDRGAQRRAQAAEAAASAVREARRLAMAPERQDVREALRLQMAILRPAAALPAPGPWPTPAFERRLQSHDAFRRALVGGTQMPESRVLIYVCTSMTFCGGHGDRLNGMLSAAVLALLTGRHFFIDSQRPVPLSLVLRPARLDWRIHGTVAAMPASFNLNDNLAGFEDDPREVLDNQASVLRLVSNQRLTPAALRAFPQQAAELGLAPRPKLHAHLFRELFQPSRALRRRLAARELPEGRLVGIHFRAGDQMPAHWKDPPRHGLGEFDEFLDCALHLEASLGWGDARFILFADTDLVLQLPRLQAMLESGKVIWPAQTDSLIHLDRSPPTLAVRGLLSVWADWWTLAFDVHALVLCHSGFGATALELGPERPAVLGKGCVPAESTTG